MVQHQKIVVIKIGGKGAENREIVCRIASSVAFLQARGIPSLIVHGGGQALSALAERLRMKAEFVAGRRVTDDQLLDLAKMTFVGKVGTDMGAWMQAAGIQAVPLSGVSAGLIQVKRRPPQHVGERLVDYGWVGDVVGCRTDLLRVLMAEGYVPLVASLGVDEEGQVYNINADTVASTLADQLGAQELVLLTDQRGLLRDLCDASSLIECLSLDELRSLLKQGVISGGMVPKLEAIASYLEGGQGRKCGESLGVRTVRLASWSDLNWLDRQESRFQGTTVTANP